ncbi:nuclear transport factor 2 family protein [Sphingobacterium tabacisoli]|uniref:Nuclear transport factor 2 family protein n=1 Tax=Sphingobacterium tabacisoli TaxID=2044855 RepID=A0ABW5L702_9SPHI|nr:nuclear transport factor 2 family protein [Sphingobacterium tabacisoli]
MTKDAILELENRLYSAIKESDLQALDELLHEDLLFIAPSGEVITKEIDLKTYREGQLKITELEPQIENLHIIDDTAVITLTIEMKGNYNGQPFEAKYRYIRFWKHTSQGIRIIGGSGTQIPI